MIIAVTGGIAAGETTVCKLFEKKGFTFFSLSDIVRKETAQRDLEPIRNNFCDVGHDLRRLEGMDALARRAYSNMTTGDWVVDSILSYEEGQYFKSKGALIIGVLAPITLRYERSRDKLDENVTFEKFIEKDEQDRSIGVNKLIEEADFVVNNDGTLEELENMIALIIKTISSSHDQK
ncbi:MAG: dephospho-CoA kinase [Candidatus Altiarchaeota archaeon]|nr:dephospho-CoA kinase [Candidatus Altiarchaeota archaeon]